MPKVTKYPHGTFSWIDGSSTDVAADKAFYGAVLGWEAQDIPIGEGQFYTMFSKNGENVAGIGAMQPEMQAAGVPSHWTAYISVDDVDAITTKAESLGATVVLPPMDVFDNGRMAIVTDPSGANVAFWQPKSHIGASLINEDGALIWNELNTRDTDAAQTFFAQLFGWTFAEIDGQATPYWTFNNNERMNGGLLQMNEQWEGMQPHWMNYIHVDDAEAAAEQVTANGGKVHFGPIKASVGDIYVVAAPSGAVLSLIQSNSIDDWTE